jgi:hypothetical protein
VKKTLPLVCLSALCNLNLFAQAGIYKDASRAPRTLLAGPVTVPNLPTSGRTLTIANFAAVAVTGGTQYWVVADTPLTGTGSEFFGTSEFVFKPTRPQAVNTGYGWVGFNGGLQDPAGEALGSIPQAPATV